MAPWHLYLMAGIYVVAGFMHFIKPRMYERIMPNYLPFPKTLVYLSGLVEIVLGIVLCFEATRTLALFGIILMLAAFLPVHFYMLTSKKAAMGLPKWVLILRIPLQFGLMYWAYSYTLL
ncbi:MAG: MauE/DoxX family redox-associated membrane protein [Allomuricauda sp.]